jgi:hypothetical protein
LLITLGIITSAVIVATLLGLPLAVRLRRPGEGWAVLAGEAFPLGIVVGALALTAAVWGGAGAAITLALGWLGLAGWAIHSIVRGDRPPAPARPSPGILVGSLVVAAGAVALRLHEVEFLPWVGDMGAYVNWANDFVRSGLFTATWPPVFPLLLAACAAVFGIGHTTAIVGTFGLALLAALAVVLRRLGVPPVIVLATVAVAAIHPHLVWFSTFPSSESLNAPLFLVWIGLLFESLTARRERLPAVLVAQLAVIATLSLLRGSGVFYAVPIIAVLIGALLVPAWRPGRRRALVVGAVTLLGTGIGYWYGLDQIPRYFVGAQVRGLVPEPLVAVLEAAGMLAIGPVSILVIVLPAAALAALAWWWRAVPAPASGRVAPVVLGSVAGGLLLLALAACLAGGTEVGSILLRIGPWFLVAAAVAFAVLPRTPAPPGRDLTLVALAVTCGMFIALHTARLGFDKGHAFYLYWDRYLVSEVLPAFLVVAALGAGSLLVRVQSRVLRTTSALVAAALVVGTSAGALVLQSSDTEMRGANDFTERLAGYATPASLALWSSTDGAAVDEWRFPNTWMSFGLPLRRSYGIDVVNAGQRRFNFAADQVLDEQLIADYLSCRPATTDVLVYELVGDGPRLGQRLEPAGFDAMLLGTESGLVSVLHQPPSDGRWTHVAFAVDVWQVTIPAAGVLPGECPPSAPPEAPPPAR